MYTLDEHYAFLRDRANLLYAAGRISIEDRNSMAIEAFALFMINARINAEADISYQHHYHYEIWEGDIQVAELVSTGHVRRLGTGELLGALNHARPPEEGFQITRYVDFQEVLVGRVTGMTVERNGEPPWHLRLADPPGFTVKQWEL